jgi:AcrR family transcriptional regulator
VTDTPRRTQQERVGESSRRLIQSAITLIADQGYASTTAQEIGLHAGYSRDMVRVRFGSKDALLDAILSSQYESRLDVPAAPDDSGLERVLGRITDLREFALSDPQLLRAMLVLNFEATQGDGVLRQRIRQWLDHFECGIADAIQAGQTDGTVANSIQATAFARETLSTSIGYAYMWITDPQFDLAAELEEWSERIRCRLSPANAEPKPAEGNYSS